MATCIRQLPVLEQRKPEQLNLSSTRGFGFQSQNCSLRATESFPHKISPPAFADAWAIIPTPSRASTGRYLTCANVGWSALLGGGDICKRGWKSPGLSSAGRG